jgi:beta-lactamase superfamily II metal-dependent hydrolase
MFLRTLFALAILSSVLGAASPNLDIYWIDAEGGASTLIVSPSGQSLLIDTANRAPDDRDAKRIFDTAQKAGLKKIDYLLTTHYHGDHVGAMEALAKLIPIEKYLDHGESIELERPRGVELYKRYETQVAGKRQILKPGDTIPLKGTNITVGAAAGKVIVKALKGGGSTPASVCDAVEQKAPETDIENNESVGFVLTFGKFKFLALGDLPWNFEKALVCPQNVVGTVDVYQTTHHGLDRSGLPQLVWAVQPKVAVMNNGPRKGGPASTFEILRKSPGLEDIWQGHLALGVAKEINTDEKMIANLEPTAECKGNLLKLSVAPDGRYTMTNARTGFSKTYASK